MRIEGTVVRPRLLPERDVQRAGGPSFAELLQAGFERVNAMQAEADQAAWALATGQVQDLHHVMIAIERASLALEMTVAIRNRLIDAYHEIMRMQV